MEKVSRRRMRRRFVAAGAALAALGALALAPAAFAQTTSGEDGTLQIREVDATDQEATDVAIQWSGDAAAVDGLTITEDGDEVEHEPPTRTDQQQAIVLTVDTSAAMRGTPLVEAKAALTQMVADRPENSVVALVSFADDAQLLVDFTNDDARLNAAIAELTGNGLTALWNGVGTAAELLQDGAPSGSQHNIVLVSGGADSGSATTPSRARGEVRDAEASVYAIGTASADPASLQSLVGAAGGAYAQADPAGIEDAMDETRLLLAQQWSVVFARGEDAPNVADLGVEVGGTQASASLIDGGQLTGSALVPRPPTESSGFQALQTEPFKLLAIVGTLVAVGLATYALVMAFTKDPSGLQTVLSPYGEGFVPGSPSADDSEETSLAKSAILQRAVDLTEEFAESRGFLSNAEAQLERANLPLRAAEAIFFYASFVVVAFILGTLLKGILIGLIVAVVFGLLGPAVVRFLAKRRRKKFMALLPDMLNLLSGTLRAGYSLMQGVEAVAQEVDEPMGMELRRICTEARLGRPLEEALDAAADRLEIADFSWAVMAIRIQREVGGNLAELLLTVADTMTQRERLRRDVAALTAEGKMSAIVLGVLPPGLALVMWVVNPTYIGQLFNTTIGNIMLGFAVVLALFGFWWMKKIIEIEI
jgi:tight adherence protein B